MPSPSLFFPTPVWASKLDNYKDANEEIYQYIKKLQKEDNQGVIRSNIKGWHSKDFNLKDKESQNATPPCKAEIFLLSNGDNTVSFTLSV